MNPRGTQWAFGNDGFEPVIEVDTSSIPSTEHCGTCGLTANNNACTCDDCRCFACITEDCACIKSPLVSQHGLTNLGDLITDAQDKGYIVPVVEYR